MPRFWIDTYKNTFLIVTILIFYVKQIMRNTVLVIISIVLLGNMIYAQDYNIGIRSGLNYSTFMGEKEEGESGGFSNGFHFGINFSWNFTDEFAVRSELLYTQNGHKQKYEGDSYYILRSTSGNYFDEGRAKMELDISNAYVGLPVTAHYKLTDKWEVHGGAYINFLVGPKAAGVLEYFSNATDSIQFRQSLDHSYNKDRAGEFEPLGGSTTVAIPPNAELFSVPRVANAYYLYGSEEAIEGRKFSVVDFGLIAGVSYYINKGFYMSGRVSYGLSDITKEPLDISLKSLDDDNNFITRDDKDTHLGIEISLGFKF